MKKSELKASIKNEIIEILSEESAEDIQDKAKAQAELNKELEKTKDLMKEGTWALGKASDINIILTQLQDISKKAYNVIGDDIFYDGLDNAISRAEELMMNAPLNEEEEDDMDKKASKAAKKGDSVSKIANKLGETTKQMKSLVKKYKDAEEPEKSKLLTRLKELTKIKKELEGLL
jgi:hypothetical protein